MNHSVSLPVSNGHKRLNLFSLVVVITLSVLLALTAGYFLFESSIIRHMIVYLPMTQGKTPAYYNDLFRLAAFEMIWVSGLLVLALVLYNYRVALLPIEKVSHLFKRYPGQSMLVMIAACALLVVATAFVVLKQFPNSSDEYVYVFQAKTLSSGKLWEKSHPVDKSFGFNHMAIRDGRTVGRFPPGWPLVLAAFMSAGVPIALVNPILSLVALFIFYRFARMNYGPVMAGWSSVMCAFTGFYIFNSASFFSHPTCLLAIVLFVYMLYLYQTKKNILYALVAGASLGLIAITRYYTAALLFLPFVIILLYQQGWRAVPMFFWIGVGSLPFLTFLLWYNYSITGNALEPVTVWAYREEGIGFVRGHTFTKGLEHIARRLMMFAFWCSPVILLLYFVLLFRKVTRKATALVVPEDYLFISLVAGYLLYYEIGGNQYGPRFYYEALPFLILFVVREVFSSRRYWMKVLFFSGMIIAILKVPFLSYREHVIVEERLDIYKLVEQSKIQNAVVLLSTGTSVLRPMPSGDLTRNDMDHTNSVLYAIDHIHANPVLMEYYKDRAFYRYVREKEEARGRLERIR